MVDIYSNALKLNETKYSEKLEELKELLLREFTDYCSDSDINFVWVGKGLIEVVDECKDFALQLEEDIQDELDMVYDDFILREEFPLKNLLTEKGYVIKL